MEQQERHYHHGDLRRALLDAALQLATERGIAGFTLREVARQAGVSHNAPYHHFADKAALVAALALESYEILEVNLREAYDQTPGTPLDKVVAIGVAYVRFAMQHPAAFRFMFRPELHPAIHANESSNDAVERAGDAAFQVVIDAIYAAQQAGLIAADQDIQLLALSAWSTAHGLAVLMLDSTIQKKFPLPQDDEQLAWHVLQILSNGLMKRDPV